jgi:hypothetical protein
MNWGAFAWVNTQRITRDLTREHYKNKIEVEVTWKSWIQDWILPFVPLIVVIIVLLILLISGVF